MKKRLAFKCWNCNRNYTLFCEFGAKPILAVECPYCGENGIVELDPYKQDKVVVYRTPGQSQADAGTEYKFPDVIPTAQPKLCT